jgi:hypothetical protein
MQIDTPDDSPPPEPPSDEPRTYTVALPDVPYITIAPHPKDIDTFGKIILLSGGGISLRSADEESTSSNPCIAELANAARPWAPWVSLPDFEYAETAVKGVLSEEIINDQLRGFTGPWSGFNSRITLRTYREYRRVLESARLMGNTVCMSRSHCGSLN